MDPLLPWPTSLRRLAWAALAFAAVLINFEGEPDRYFTYFTVLTNLGLGLWFAAAAGLPAPERRSALRLSLAVAALVTVAVYWVLLAPTHHPHGLHWWANLALHGLVPAAFLLEDLLVPWPPLGANAALLALVFPSVYCLASLLRAQVTGWYPYFFLNPAEAGGWPGVVAFVAAILLLFVAFTYAWRAVVGLRRRVASAA